jgi:membrane protein DedA with SNARE-associated domain
VNTVFEILQSIALLLRNGTLPQWGFWSYLLLALLVAIEGPVATLLGAAAASAGLMQPLPVFISAATGNLTADSLWYTLGYMGKIEWILRIGRRAGINQLHLERLQQSMRKHVTMILFFAKLSVSLVIPSLIAAGLVKVPWKRWFPAIFGAEMIWTGSLLLIGYYATEALQRVELGIEYYILFASALFVVIILWLGRRILFRVADNPTISTTGPNRKILWM